MKCWYDEIGDPVWDEENNDEDVPNTVIGNFVDNEIYRVSLPAIIKGMNTLIVTLPLGDGTNTENVFVLGDFGVRAEGRKARIIEKPERIDFGAN